jgi:hypothetical protein
MRCSKSAGMLHARCAVSVTKQLVDSSQEDLLGAARLADSQWASLASDLVPAVCVEAALLPRALLNAAHKDSSQQYTAHDTYVVRWLVVLLHMSCIMHGALLVFSSS